MRELFPIFRLWKTVDFYVHLMHHINYIKDDLPIYFLTELYKHNQYLLLIFLVFTILTIFIYIPVVIKHKFCSLNELNRMNLALDLAFNL